MPSRNVNDRKYGVVTTTNATQTVIASYVLPTGVVCHFEAAVIGRDPVGNVALFRQVAVSNGSRIMVGSVVNVFPAIISTALAGTTVTMNIASSVMRVLVTGKTATTIEWSCDLEIWEN